MLRKELQNLYTALDSSIFTVFIGNFYVTGEEAGIVWKLLALNFIGASNYFNKLYSRQFDGLANQCEFSLLQMWAFLSAATFSPAFLFKNLGRTDSKRQKIDT